ncbi:hypothetical protein BFR38_12020 [Brochothrix thermosphacta]|uniref:bacteriocin-associated integral membrane family protein n=1 Tax=Brochothrix thermosphacta TaxID=2756 RepID=UPI00083F554C|nr:hypothetical protein [Brochothrix thermosphacta]ODJ51907.1 hypothetical protein BFR38_12020 [Brochothrix thermosphacta]ODJ58965.1 hypothetical protein BFR42_11980 [Brochothrix thermosphacta]
MKKAFILSFFTIALLLFFSTKLFLTTHQFQTYNAIKKESAYTVTVADDADVQTANDWTAKMITSSQTYHFNIYKESVSSITNQLMVYAQLNHHKQKITAGLDLKPFGNEQYTNKKHVYSEFNQLLLSPLTSLKNTELKSGNYVIQLSKQSPHISVIIKDLSNKTGVNIALDKQSEVSHPQVLFSKIIIFLSIFITSGILMFIIVSDYYIKYRQNSIKLMVGYRHITLLSDIIKRQLPYALMIPLITFSLASYYYFINAIKPAFNIAIFATLLGLTVLLLTYLLIASFLIFYPLNSRSSKGESPQKKLVVLLLAVKIILSIFLLFTLQFSGQKIYYFIVEQAQTQRALKAVEHRFYLPLLSDVSSTDDNAQLDNLVRTNHLFNDYYNHGMLLFRLEDDTEHKLLDDEYNPGHEKFENNVLLISPDYLKLNPLYDINGTEIKINNHEKTLITLVPTTYYALLPEIKSYIEKEHNFQNNEVGKNFGLKATPQKVKFRYIEIRDNQALLTLLPHQRPLKNPLIKVLTQNNVDKNLSAYADSISGRADTFFIGNTQTSMSAIKNIVEKNQLQKTYPEIIPAQIFLKERFTDHNLVISLFLTIIIITLSLYLLLTLSFIHNYLLLNIQKALVLLQAGYPITRIYCLLFLIGCSPWLLLTAYNLIITQRSVNTGLFTLIGFIEFTILYVCLYRIKYKLLKGSLL